ncbi:MAG: HEPN domain-containing protein [Thermoproteota archaeon]|nr:HEPN domain-containing protein [Candidatus Brockarchaeota archaeon]
MSSVSLARRWLKQAERDLKAARDSFNSRNYEWACFQAQQAAEKALKAILFLRGFRAILTHSIFELVNRIGDEELKKEDVKFLDSVYIASRYPNSFSEEVVPSEYFDEGDAEKCLRLSESILAKARKHIETWSVGS